MKKIYAGVDIGSTTTKVILFDGEKIVSSSVSPSGINPTKTAQENLGRQLGDLGLDMSNLYCLAATGYGRRLIKNADLVVTEIKACAAGAYFLSTIDGRPRTVVDIGGQDTKVIVLDEKGGVANFAMNDKCAAGTGRFLEVLAMKLEMNYDDFVQSAMRSENAIHMNSTCAVFAESEVVSLLARGISKSDIAAAAHNSIAGRVGSMIRRLGVFSPPIFFAGGGALNKALVKALEDNLSSKIHSSVDSQKVVALGAAYSAFSKSENLDNEKK